MVPGIKRPLDASLVSLGRKCYRKSLQDMDATIRYLKYVLFAGYSHSEIAAVTNYSRTGVVNALQRGPSLEFLLRCALATGTPPGKLLDLAGKHDLAQRFNSVFPPGDDQSEEQLLARIRLLQGRGIGRLLENQVKGTEERLAGFEETFAQFAKSAGATAGFVAANGQVAVLWGLPLETAASIMLDPPDDWHRYGEEGSVPRSFLT